MQSVVRFAVLLVLGLSSFVLAEELPDFDVAVGSRMIIPRKNELYDHSAGVSIMARHWFDKQWGVGLSAGFESWRLDDDKVNIAPVELKLEGQTRVFPVGVHALWRFDSGEPFAPIDLLTGEPAEEQNAYAEASWLVSVGVRRLFMDDSGELEVAWPGGELVVPLETDDAWVACVEVAYEDVLPFFDEQKFIVGAGYQRDLSRDDVAVKNTGIAEDNDMSGAYLRLGVPIVF